MFFLFLIVDLKNKTVKYSLLSMYNYTSYDSISLAQGRMGGFILWHYHDGVLGVIFKG